MSREVTVTTSASMCCGGFFCFAVVCRVGTFMYRYFIDLKVVHKCFGRPHSSMQAQAVVLQRGPSQEGAPVLCLL